MATERPDDTAAEKGATAKTIEQPETPIGTVRSDHVAEAEVVAGRGPETTFEFQPRPVALSRGVAALRHRDFRLYWGGQLISLIGTWMQIVAQSWLVLQLSNSALILGLLGALQFLPILLFSVLGGVAADRLPKRRLLLITQTSSLLLAVALAVLTQAGVVRIGHVMALALLLGMVNAVDMPTRQAFVVELVAGRDLRNAIALNSAAFNSARLIGPAVAGLAIGWVGVAGCFYLNAVSFLAAIAGLAAIQAGRRPSVHRAEESSVREDLREGLAYVVHTPLVWLVVLLVALVGTFGMNMAVLVPVLARDVLQVGAAGFGLLTSIAGVGSLAAALLIAFTHRIPGIRVLTGAAAALGLAEIALGGVRQFVPAALTLGVAGFSMIAFTTLSNTVLQLVTPDGLRGRVMSVYATVFAGTTPLGSLFAGAVAQASGVGASFFVGGLISVAAAAGAYLFGARGRGVGDGTPSNSE